LNPGPGISIKCHKNASHAGGKHNKGAPILHYQISLDVALASLKHYQPEGGITTFLQLESDIRHQQLKVPEAFIVEDSKSQDHLC
jgi:hypothetical protein